MRKEIQGLISVYWVVGFILFTFLLLFIAVPNKAFAQDDQGVCMTLYDPVCGLVDVDCVTQPCDPIAETFSNRCFLDNDDRAQYLYDGECNDETVQVAKIMHDNIAQLSPIEPVLGGSWYVLELEFYDQRDGLVLYEDGHIENSFMFSWDSISTGETEQISIMIDTNEYIFINGEIFERVDDDGINGDENGDRDNDVNGDTDDDINGDEDTNGDADQGADTPLPSDNGDSTKVSWRESFKNFLQRSWSMIRALFL